MTSSDVRLQLQTDNNHEADYGKEQGHILHFFDYWESRNIGGRYIAKSISGVIVHEIPECQGSRSLIQQWQWQCMNL